MGGCHHVCRYLYWGVLMLKMRIGKLEQSTGEIWKTETIELPFEDKDLKAVFKKLRISKMDEAVIVCFENQSTEILRLLNKINDFETANDTAKKLQAWSKKKKLLLACIETHSVNSVDELLELSKGYELVGSYFKTDYGKWYAKKHAKWYGTLMSDWNAERYFNWQAYTEKIIEEEKHEVIFTRYGALRSKEAVK